MRPLFRPSGTPLCRFIELNLGRKREINWNRNQSRGVTSAQNSRQDAWNPPYEGYQGGHELAEPYRPGLRPLPEQEDSVRRHPTLLLAMCQRRLRMPHERQTQQARVPPRIHRVSRGEGSRLGIRGPGTQGFVGREGREDRHAFQDARPRPPSTVGRVYPESQFARRRQYQERLCVAAEGRHIPHPGVASASWGRELRFVFHGRIEWARLYW